MSNDLSKEELLKEAERRGFEYERDYRNCSQCTLLIVQELFGLENEDALKAATGFSGGIGRLGSVCGGFSGAVMALGLLFGRDLDTMKHPNPEIRLKRLESMEMIGIHRLVKKLSEKYIETYGSIICDDIEKKVIGRSFNKWDPEERKEKDRLGGHLDKCPSVVSNAARWVVELILEEQEKRKGLYQKAV